MKIVIVIHSVCGNTYLVGKAFEEAFRGRGNRVVFLRVADPDWAWRPDIPEASRPILDALQSLPEAAPRDLLDADIVLIGSPVYFGNVSAEIKTFMDATGGLWFQGKLIGKRFAAFVSAGNPEGGGDLTLQVLHTYARYMGMLCIPMPVTVLPGENTNALGLIQYSCGKYAVTLDEKTARLVNNWASLIAP